LNTTNNVVGGTPRYFTLQVIWPAPTLLSTRVQRKILAPRDGFELALRRSEIGGLKLSDVIDQ